MTPFPQLQTAETMVATEEEPNDKDTQGDEEEEKLPSEEKTRSSTPPLLSLATSTTVSEASSTDVATESHGEFASETEEGVNVADKAMTDLIGKTVETPYGKGQVVDYRPEDLMYAIQLETRGGSGCPPTLYTNNAYSVKQREESSSTDPTTVPQEDDMTTLEHHKSPVLARQTSMELDVAYQSLEKMRILNLEMECHARGVTGQVDFQQCTTCLLENTKKQRFPRLQKLVDQHHGAAGSHHHNKTPVVVLPRIQRIMDNRQRARSAPCLICASPSCPVHSSVAFRKEGITLCQSCELFFQLDFISDCVSNPDPIARAKHVDRMIDLYDRSLLLLRYSSQYIEQVAESLEHSKKKQNKIGLGSSGVGIVSGALGIAAAATILTPAGPPLLIASLLFGGSATAVQTGTEAMNYFSEPSQLADRIIALHGISKSILRVTCTLRDAIARHGRLGPDHEDDTTSSMQERMQENYEKSRSGLVAGATVGRSLTLGSAAGSAAEVSAMGTRSATAFSRAGTAAARTVRFARFAGGALSAAVLVMEANAIQSTIKQIKAGNPCDKAELIRRIKSELDTELPSSDTLDGECRAYLETLQQPVTLRKEQETDVTLSQVGATIVEGEDDFEEEPKTTMGAGNQSLLKRIQMHKLRESLNAAEEESPMISEQGGVDDLNLELIG